MIAKIAVAAATFAIDRPYSYLVPQGLAPEPGMRVMVPFGRGNTPTEGVVLEVAEGFGDGLKTLLLCLDDAPLLNGTMLRLASFMRERYFCTFYDAVRAMLPAGLWFSTRQFYTLTEDQSWREANIRTPCARRILEELENLGGRAGEESLKALGEEPQVLEKALAYLLRKKWIQGQQTQRRRIGDKTEQIATLASTPEEAMEFAATRPRSAAQQRSVLTTLCALGSVAVKELCYFTGASLATVKRLEALGYLALSSREVLRCHEIVPAPVEGPLALNEEQRAAFEGLSSQLRQEKPGVALLYGVTGSGKTAVYLGLIQACLDRGQSAMLLVPEIALTPQLLGLVSAYFGQTVAVLHSSLAPTERYDQWKRVKKGDARVVVGTRSAVFAPCQNLGLIVLDEEQEHSYRSENNPRYAAKEVAIWRGAKEGAMVLLGSATPSIETMYRAMQGDYTLYRLESRYGGRSLPQVEIVDMRRQMEEGNALSLSYPLLDALRETRRAGKQTILFLNRRGNSRALVCVDCGEAPECPRCSARLTYHSANGRVMCHYCGYSRPVPDRCHCGGALKRVGIGTQKVEEELKQIDPALTVARMDTDTVTATNTHEAVLQRFQQENIPVLLGTQMVAKGLNLPNVTLVGVLDADLSLYSEDYRAAETTFNMLTQVVGRSGRGSDAGRAMIQTLAPQNQVIQLAARQDYDGFYGLEIQMRRLQQLPPFGDLTQVLFLGADEGLLLRSCQKFRESLRAILQTPPYNEQPCTVLGPAPCAVPKINYHFRYRLTLRGTLNRPLRQLLAHLLREFARDPANRDMAAYVDCSGNT